MPTNKKKRFLDVWIIDSNSVYREVPFTVVVDWIQQGRLLEEDKLKPSGTAEWQRLADVPTFAAYLPRTEPHRAEDEAEALEPVEVDFTWKNKPFEEDDDVDMIPLIDVSLVLLIFFIMTTTAAYEISSIPTPKAEYGWVISNPDSIWIGIDGDADRAPIYSLGQGDQRAEEMDDKLGSQEELLVRLDERLKEMKRPQIEVIIRANEAIPSGVVRRLNVELERRKSVKQKFYGVREKNP